MNRNLVGTVTLPGSKSESNRALMIAAYGGFPLTVGGLSDAHDTVLLQSLLQRIVASQRKDPLTVDCEDAGTVARFLMTFLATTPGVWLLTGTPRLRQRPIAPLVEALRQLGATIRYQDKEGQLPVLIQGKTLRGGAVELDATLSSQFVSSLLLAAPQWERGLTMKIHGKHNSWPYVGMTMALMRHYGAEVLEAETLTVKSMPYHPASYAVGADWSAASYWYEMAALSQHSNLLLKGLKMPTLQGDVVVASLFRGFGVETLEEEEGVRLLKTGGDSTICEPMVFDFSETPDLFPAVFVTCVALGRPAQFKGISNLSFKESDRVKSLITELSKKYTFINIIDNDEIKINKSTLSDNNIYSNKALFNTHSDHRIAMSLFALSLKFGEVVLDHPEVVSKSYPSYWSDIQRLFE